MDNGERLWLGTADEENGGLTRRTVLAGVTAGVALSVAGCLGAPSASDSGSGGDGGDGGQVETNVTATLSDYAIDLSPATVPAGTVVFDVENTAGQVHEFVVVRTDLAPDSLPTDSNGDVAEDELDIVGEVEDLEAESSESLRLNLEAGNYVTICNLPAHYRLGMYDGLTVE